MSSWLAFPLQRSTFAFVVLAALLAAGATTLLQIPKTEDPVFPIPSYPITIVVPGASPADLERLVVDPIERELKSLENLKTMKSTASDGVAFVLAEFESGVDPDAKFDEVNRAVAAVTLPANTLEKRVEQYRTNNVKVLMVSVQSQTAPWRDLERTADDVQRVLESVPGVRDAEQHGTPQEEVRVIVDAPRAAALGVTLVDVAQALQRAGAEIPGGALAVGDRQLTVSAAGGLDGPDDVRTTIVRADARGAVTVADVATVLPARAAEGTFVRTDGVPAILVSATLQQGQDVLAVQKGMHAALAAFHPPSNVQVQAVFDQAENVSHRLSGFVRDFILAIFLVLLTLLPLGTRASLVVMVSVPLSLAMGVVVLNAFGFTINQLSIVGFVIALGLLVDDSIVVVESIARAARHGKSPREAALEATRAIAPSVLGCTATLILAFVPLMALPGGSGDFIRSLPVAVVATISASLLVSLFVVPLLASRFLSAQQEEHGNVFLRGMTRAVEAVYRPLLRVALGNPKSTVVTGVVGVALSFALVPAIGFSLFPNADIPEIQVKIELPTGASLTATDRVTRRVEQTIADAQRAGLDVRHVVTTVGKGTPQFYYNLSPHNRDASRADLLLVLEHFDPKTTPALLDDLRRRLDAIDDATVSVNEMQQGPPVEAPVAMRVVGNDLQQLEAASRLVADAMRKTPGLRDVDDPGDDVLPDVRLDVDHGRAAQLGVPIPLLQQAVRARIAGLVVGSVPAAAGGDDDRDVVVTAARDGAIDQATGSALDDVFVPSAFGPLPLRHIATPVVSTSPAIIRHVDDQRSITVAGQVQTGVNVDAATKDVLAALSRVPLPDGVRLVPAGQLASRQESFGGMGSAILIAVFGILAVLILEFGTFRGSLVVAAVIPFGIAGGLAALFLSGYTLSFTSMVGFVALVGIEVKNSILLVDLTDSLRARGVKLDDAIVEAGEVRFVPILLTTATALGGLVPLILENSSLFSPLAVVIAGGLLSSTFIARLITPVVYKLLQPEVKVDGGGGSAVSAGGSVGVQAFDARLGDVGGAL